MVRKQDKKVEDELIDESLCHRGAPGHVGPRVLVVGGATVGVGRNDALLDFPLILRRDGEPAIAHVARVDRALRRAISAGATHLVVPRERTAWLMETPELENYLSRSFGLQEATRENGLVFELSGKDWSEVGCETVGWQALPRAHLAFEAATRLKSPQIRLTLSPEVRGRLHLSLSFRVAQLKTIRVRAVLARPDRKRAIFRDLYLSVSRPGQILHAFDFAEATFSPDGWVDLDLDLRAEKGRALIRVELQPIEDDNWRVHPMFPGGTSFMLPDAAPKGATISIRDFAVTRVPTIRRGNPHGIVRNVRFTPYRKVDSAKRDAVIFSSWVPESGLILGDYFIDVLKRWHSDSRIFVGINHGSDPEWPRRLQASGLDVCLAPAPKTLTMPFDPTGFVSALSAFRRDPEEFDLVWFGHNKGGDHLGEAWYGTGRWMLERVFWSRRQEIEQFFDNEMIGSYAPHYLMLLQDHLRQTDALLRMYRATCMPLGAMAVSAHFVLRDSIVRDFCRRVSPYFFTHGPELFGGDRFFVEMTLPDLALMQGYEPYLERGLGGLSRWPKQNGMESVLNDWRNNQAVVAIELDKWRMAPTRFRTAHCEHNRVV